MCITIFLMMELKLNVKLIDTALGNIVCTDNYNIDGISSDKLFKRYFLKITFKS
ncbi:MAG: hypothetical protein ACI936_000942 [Paraglaciecola sp.]|jgi:hypothetical protein